ncbi:SusC/RagA family TonB-linked outer membrane protein [Sphingobacterium sp. LRF_L2]|uniref:SusC/RagA family TonB-linked outer membrane protein n=1 Tax=Sphingobacterium sp. LRF_L2 TaxID=3369421 RepID=UPI003F648395
MSNQTVKVFVSLVLLVYTSLPIKAQAAGNQRIEFKAQNKSLKTILNELEKQSGYYFLYDNEVLTKNPRVNIDFDNLAFRDALASLSKKVKVDYKITDKTVTLIEKPGSSAIIQDELLIKGIIKIKDRDNEVPYTASGVSIVVKGTSRGVTTNFRGEFDLKAPKNSTLVISFLGYEKREVKLEDKSPFDINLILNQIEGELGEVVVMAYGTKETRENQIGSAFTITAKDIEKRPALRIDALLEGVVPGVQFSSQDDNNGSARPRYSTRVRGESSSPYGVMSNEPLWVIDGVPLNTGGTTNSISGVETTISPLTYLNTEDIESLTVLKDANATAIYGASGSNGVILITTKKGKGAPNVNYSFRTTFNRIAEHNRFHVLNGNQYREIAAEMGLSQDIAAYEDVSTDWLDVFYRNGRINIHNLSVSGSNENTNYYISGSVYDEKLMSLGNGTKRYSLRSQVGTDISSRLSLNFVFGGSYNANDMFSFGDTYYSNLPVISPYDRNGDYALYDYAGTILYPSIAEAYQNDNDQTGLQSFAQMQANFRILDGLEFVSRNGIDFSALNEKRYSSMLNLTGKDDNGYLYKNQARMHNWVSTNTLNYNRSLFDGQFSAMLGMEANRSYNTFVGASAYNFPNDNVREINMAPSDNRRSSGSADENSSLSYLGRIGYLWKNRYNVNVNYRRDGDSDFGSDVKWATFYAIGGAWTISNEAFWKSEAINFFKLKATYGTTGNGRFNSNYAKGVYRFEDTQSYGNNIGATMYRGRNNSVKWETTYKFNTGIDFGILDRVTVGIEYYKDVTHDLINDSPVSLTSGQKTVYQNIGKLQNQGVELTVNSQNINSKDLKWNTSFNLSLNRNKVLELANNESISSTTTIMEVGADSRSYYLVRWAGVDPSTGDPMWYDVNGNITKVYDANNRVNIGSPNPDFYGGMTNILSYKNFNLSFLLTYTQGGLSFSALRREAEHDGLNLLSSNLSTNILDHWMYPGDLAVNPRLTSTSNGSNRNSTRYLQEKTNVQLKNVSLEYNLSSDFLQRLHIKKASVYVQGDNLGMWTPYKTSKKRNLSNGGTETIKINNYANSFAGVPYQTSLSLGLNIRF